MRQPPTAVVINANLNGLGVVRGLGRGGVSSCVIDDDPFKPAMWSRHATPVRTPTLDGVELLDALVKLGASMKTRPVLFNCHETAVAIISKHRARLESTCRFRLPPHETVMALQDKAQFHELATAHAFNVPNGLIVSRRADIQKLQRFRFPLIAKPADKTLVHSGKAPGVAVFKSFGAAADHCERMLNEASDTLVQEWVEGANEQIYFCLFYRGRNDRTVGMFTGRKLLSWPANIGMTAYCTAAPEARDILEPMTEGILDKIGYAGMGSVEYKWDKADRRFVIIEPTVGRTDWQEEIATLSGVNIPLAAYCHEMELPEPAAEAPERRVVWRSSVVDRWRSPKPSMPADAVICDGYWRADDPAPALVQYSIGLTRSATRALKRRAGLAPEFYASKAGA